MRVVLLGLLCFCMVSCREYYPFDQPVEINGYMLSGKVTSVNGIPYDSVAVTLRYYFYLRSEKPLDTVMIPVSPPVKYMDVAVFTPENVRVRQLYAGYPPTGTFTRQHWNELNAQGKYVPSGKYLIRYVYGGVTVKEIPVIVEDRITTYTDASGEFTLTNDMLPVGQTFDIYDTDSPTTYYGAYEVSSRIRLYMTRKSLAKREEIDVEHNQLTRRVFTLQ